MCARIEPADAPVTRCATQNSINSSAGPCRLTQSPRKWRPGRRSTCGGGGGGASKSRGIGKDRLTRLDKDLRRTWRHNKAARARYGRRPRAPPPPPGNVAAPYGILGPFLKLLFNFHPSACPSILYELLNTLTTLTRIVTVAYALAGTPVSHRKIAVRRLTFR